MITDRQRAKVSGRHYSSTKEREDLRFSGPSPQRIAVLRALQLGDLLCAVPALRSLRHAFPSADITLIGLPWARGFVHRFSAYLNGFMEFPGYPGLPERDANARDILSFLASAQCRRFDLAIQMHGSGSFVNPLLMLLGAERNAGFFTAGDFCPDPALFLPWDPAEPEVRRYLRLMNFIGVASRGDQLEFPIHQEDRRLFAAHEKMAALRPGEYACVHPGAQLPSRRWPPARFAAVADALADMGLRVVLTGSSAEKFLTREVHGAMKSPALDLAGETNLGTLAVLLERSRLLVSNDTGLSHMAAALEVPSVIVASGSDVGRWAPQDANLHRVLHHPIHCRPCSYAVCPIGHPCALEISCDAVVQEVMSLMRSLPASRPARDLKEEGVLCAG
jgi:ADP-heptose:LPS heptosyltransferase